MPDLAVSGDEAQEVSHNLLGQRLGKKGRGTRERILAAAARLAAEPDAAPITLSAVARDASLGMTTLYLYFSDLNELLLAVLDPIMASAEESYVGRLRQRWPDDDLATHCEGFVRAFHRFWEQNASILHLRNSNAAGLDGRMARHRIESARPSIDLLVAQMDTDPAIPGTLVRGMATALFTGIERVVTVATDAEIPRVMEGRPPNVDLLLRGQARLLELGVRDGRTMAGR